MSTNDDIITKKPWTVPVLENLDLNIIKQDLLQQESELLGLLSQNDTAFRLLTGSTPG